MRVPRYTSYPTAPNFSAAVDSSEYRRWLRGLPEDEPVSVYLHIPFCREMCWYCGCHTTVTRRKAPVSRYVSTLLHEIGLVAAEMPGRAAIGHLHLGGGSPTVLTPADVERLGASLRSSFELAPGAEVAVEVDPRTLSDDLAAALNGMGVNRASIGVQTFDPHVQAAINRIQSFDVAAAAANRLRRHGIAALNFDLMYGLPLQTARSCLQTVWQALQLRPNRLSVFGYAHVPGFKPHQRKIRDDDLPGPAERLEQASAIEEALLAAGYMKIGLDHFALPEDELAIAAANGALHRNFQGYTTDGCSTLIGFGASAIGRLPQGFVQNTTRIPDYQERVSSGRLAAVRGCRLSVDDQRRAEIIEQLMCNYRARVGGFHEPATDLEAQGLVRRDGDLIEVVEEARPLVRVIAAAFDAYLPKSAATHVSAV
jgi:oxygen-independent coproporphyrinogen-3 oxidase